jgi:glycosyltransferase involved in cell wall biosynthesis
VSPAIVHVASGREWRGGQRQIWLLARELARRGTEQVVVTGEGSELASRLSSGGIPVRTASWRAGLDPRVVPAILRELRQRPAILHAHDAHALTLAGIAAALSGSPLVVTRRVTFPLRHRFFWKRACRVIAISEAVHHALVDDGLSPERVVLVPSAVDAPDPAGPPNADIRTGLGLPKNGQVAVSLGALTPEKDQSTLIDAAALLVRDLPDLHWAIAGEGPLRGELESRIVRRGLQGRVHLMGHLDDPHAALAGADIFVLSSTAEGLGSSLLAAMVRDVPVVATRVGGVPDVLGGGGGVMVPPHDPGELARAVRRVLEDPALRLELKLLARKDLARFSVSAVAERVLTVYRSCAHSLDGS